MSSPHDDDKTGPSHNAAAWGQHGDNAVKGRQVRGRKTVFPPDESQVGTGGAARSARSNMDKADHILDLMADRPGLLNSLVLRLLERGVVAENLAFMHDKLGMKIALPWIHYDVTGEVPYWARHRYGHETTDLKPAEVTTAVESGVPPATYVWVTGDDMDSTEANTPEAARAAADADLHKKGWVLL